MIFRTYWWKIVAANVWQWEANYLKTSTAISTKIQSYLPNYGQKNVQLSEKEKSKSIFELTINVKKVMEQLHTDKESTLKLSNVNLSLPSVILQNKLSEEKKRLRDLYNFEKIKLNKSVVLPATKKENRRWVFKLYSCCFMYWGAYR